MFQTGKIPTQDDFENLISKIPNNDLTGGGGVGMGDIDFIAPICIHSLIKLHNVENNNYIGAMSILQRTVYNGMTVGSEWKKIMELQGYEDGLIIDDSGVAENFMNTIHANCYKQIQLR